MVNSTPNKKHRSHSGGLVVGPDLERPVVSLAESIQKAMAALYNLHTALINALGPTHPFLDQFRHNREVFRLECDNLVLFLQHCHGHAEDYTSLCQFTLTREPSECWTFFEDVYVGAQRILREANDTKLRHERGYKELQKSKGKLKAAFTRSLPRPPSPMTSGSRVRKQRMSSTDASNSAFLQTAHAALHPDGLQSVNASFLNLKDIGPSLRDIVAFWEDHVGHLTAISEKRVELVRPKTMVLKTVESWTRYQSVLLAAISSISESSDAVMVDPVGAPNPRLLPSQSISVPDPQTAIVRLGFWDKIWEKLMRDLHPKGVGGCMLIPESKIFYI